MGQTHVRRWTDDLTRRIEEEEIDPSFVITHKAGLDEGPAMYRLFEHKQDSCIKVMLRPCPRLKLLQETIMNEAASLVVSRPDQSLTVTDRVARGLGWFSLALGLAEIVAPDRLARALGLEGHERLLRAYGLREIGSGMGALSVDPAPAVWSRVAGDLLDLGTLAVGLRNGDEKQRRNAALAIAAVLGITVADLLTAKSLGREMSEDVGEKRDYSDRSGFPRGVEAVRGIAAGGAPGAPARSGPETGRQTEGRSEAEASPRPVGAPEALQPA
jgi:hypothetical protein